MRNHHRRKRWPRFRDRQEISRRRCELDDLRAQRDVADKAALALRLLAGTGQSVLALRPISPNPGM